MSEWNIKCGLSSLGRDELLTLTWQDRQYAVLEQQALVSCEVKRLAENSVFIFDLRDPEESSSVLTKNYVNIIFVLNCLGSVLPVQTQQCLGV